MCPQIRFYGESIEKQINKLHITAELGGERYAAEFTVPESGMAELTVTADIPPAQLDGGKAEIIVSANVDYTGERKSSVYLLSSRLELYKSGGVTYIDPTEPVSEKPLGYDYHVAGEQTAKLNFTVPQTDRLTGARLVSVLRVGADAAVQKRRLLVSLDGSEWFGAELDAYADGGEHDIAVKIPVERFAAGEVGVIIYSNIDSAGNMTGATLDLIHATGGSPAGKSYIGNNVSNWSGALHVDRDLCIALRFTTADGSSVTYDYSDKGRGRATCVIGKYMGNLDFYHKQLFNVSSLDEIVSAEVIVRAHVGADIRTADEGRDVSSYENHLLNGEFSDLGAGASRAAKLTLDISPAPGEFAKLTVHAIIKSEVSQFSRIYVSVNGGPRRAAYVLPLSGRAGGGYYGLYERPKVETELEFPVNISELRAGDNMLEFSADPVGKDKILLCGSDSGEPLVGLTVYTSPAEGWIDAPVPSAWETYAPDDNGCGKYISFDGVGWYKRRINLGGQTEGFRDEIRFKGVDYYCEVWYNGIFVGSHEGGYDEFSFDFDPLGQCAREGELVVRVTDQSFDIKDKFYIKATPAGFLQDSIGMNYGGIWQSVSLESVSDVSICDLFALPNNNLDCVELRVRLRNTIGIDARVTLRVSVMGDDTAYCSDTVETVIPARGVAETVISVDMTGCERWSADLPKIYLASVEAEMHGKPLTGASVRFGMRSVCAAGTELRFNGQRLVLTGVLDWLFNFDIFSPAISPELLRAQILKLREAGFNSVKYCLVVPPEYMLDILDEVGMYAYVEYPMWYERECADLFCRAYEQLPRQVCQNRNHPCLVMSDFNCELPDYSPQMDALMRWVVETAKKIAPNRLYLDNSSCGVQRYGDLCAVHPYHQLNRFSDIAELHVNNRGRTKPMVFGEYADTDTVRDTAKVRELCGGKLPWWWEIFGINDPERILMGQGISRAENVRITRVSIENALESKKYYIEETKKCPDVAALFITHKNDIGQTIPGLFDELGNIKFAPAKLAHSARENALLLDISSFNMRAGAEITARISCAISGGSSVINGCLCWRLLQENGEELASGEIDGVSDTDCPRLMPLGELRFNAPESDTVKTVRLEVRLKCEEFTTENEWSLWVYPNTSFIGHGLAVYDPGETLGLRKYYPNAVFLAYNERPEGVGAVIATAITPEIEAYLRLGGTLLYIGAGSEFIPVSKVYNWNAYSMPFIPNPSHSALGGVGKRGFGCLDFLELFTEDAMASGLSGENVIIRRIEQRTYRAGSYLTELGVGRGRLIQTTLRLGETPVDVLRGGGIWLDTEHENTVGRYLLDRLAAYALTK
jgi:Beta-galactosidase/beta-glucuronidase